MPASGASSAHRVGCERRQAKGMTGRIEQHSPTRVRLLWQRGAKRNRPLPRRTEIVGGEIKVHDRRPRPVRWDIPVDLLSYQHSPGYLDRDAGLLRPQLAASEQPQVEVGKPLRVRTIQRDGH